MADGSRTTSSLEGRGGLIGATALVGLVVSTLSAYGVWSSFQSRGWEADFTGLLLRFAAGWSLWVLVTLPVVALSLLLWRRGGPWPLAVLLQLALSAGVAWGHAWSNDRLQVLIDPLLSDEDGRGAAGSEGRRWERGGERSDDVERFGGDEHPGPADDRDADRGGRRPSRRPRGGPPGRWSEPRRQLPFSFLQYWVVVALGAGLVGTRRARAEERRAAAAELDATRAQAALVQARLEALRAQVHPHFLFNALHTVGGLVREGREDDALIALRGLGDLLRAALRRGPDRQETTLDDELALVREYLALESLRFAERLDPVIEQQDGTGDLPVPCLCLLPLVENAVRYAVEPRAEGGRLVLATAVEGDELVLSVSDDGPGFPADVLAAGGGSATDREQVGLANTARRLEMLYGGAGRMVLENPPGGGARVTLRLPRGGTRS